MSPVSNSPNIILLVLDTTRAQNCSCYGYPRPTTPSLDAIAEQGVLYENAIATACWSLPSHTSILTGLYPSTHGAHERHKFYDHRYPLLMEVLKECGYETYGVSINSWVSKDMGNIHGFDQYVKLWQLFQADTDLAGMSKEKESFLERLQSVGGALLDGNLLHNLVNGIYGRWIYKLFISATHVNRHMMRLIDGAQQPFFMYAAYWETHLPYRSRPSFVARFLSPEHAARQRRVNRNPWRYIAGEVEMEPDDFELLRGLYDAALAYLDSEIGRLYAFLSERGLLRNTVLILTSDHGDNIGDHELMDHAYSLHDTLLRVPLVVHYPDGPDGLRVAEQVQLVDIFPTVARVAGCRDPAVWDELQGRDIHPSQGSMPRDRDAFSECLAPHPSIGSLRKRVKVVRNDLSVYDRSLEAVRTTSHKLIWASDGRHELYDLAGDPTERRNLVSEKPALVDELRARLDAWRAECPLPESAEGIEHSSEVMRRLKDLGYIE